MQLGTDANFSEDKMMRTAFGKKDTLLLASRRSQHIPKKDLLLIYQDLGLHILHN
jgi:hypothetical protein